MINVWNSDISRCTKAIVEDSTCTGLTFHARHMDAGWPKVYSMQSPKPAGLMLDLN